MKFRSIVSVALLALLMSTAFVPLVNAAAESWSGRAAEERPAVSVSLDTDHLEFGPLFPGTVSTATTVSVANRGTAAVEVGLGVEDEGEGTVFSDGLRIDGGRWSDYRAFLASDGTDIFDVSLSISEDAAGSFAGSLTVWANAIPVPEADFSAEVIDGEIIPANGIKGLAPLEVQFTDLSTSHSGVPNLWSWDLDGDGTIDSTEKDPSYVYGEAGIYAVSLTVTNLAGSDIETKTGYITVISAPLASFTANVTGGLAPLDVQFTDTSYGVPSEWWWDFGDGNFSDEQNPTHTYERLGVYYVNLTVTNILGSDHVNISGCIAVIGQGTPVSSAFLSSIYYYPPSIAMGPDGTIYLLTTTLTAGLATPGAYDTTVNIDTDFLGDMIVVRYSSDLSTVLSATYFGGIGYETAYAISVASDGTVYVAGTTTSSGLATEGAYSTTYSSGDDEYFQYNGVIARFSPDLSELLNCTYFGASGYYDITLTDMTIASDGSIYVTGSVPAATTGLATPGAYQQSHGGGLTDFIIARFTPDLSTLLNCTYFGGSSDDEAWGIAIAGDSTVYVYGYSSIARFDADLSALLNFTSVSAKMPNSGMLAISSDGDVYIVAKAAAASWEGTDGSFEKYDGANIVAVFDRNLTEVKAAARFGSALDYSNILLSDGSVFVIGSMQSGIPITPDAYQPTIRGGPDFFILRISEDLSTVQYGSWLGGSSVVGSDGIEVHGTGLIDGDGNLVMAGGSNSADLPVVDGNQPPATGHLKVVYRLYFGDYPSYEPVARFTSDVTTTTESELPLAVQFTFTGSYAGAWRWDFGDGNFSTEKNPAHVYDRAGSYTVTLTAVNGAGSDTVVMTGYIRITAPPVSDFEVSSATNSGDNSGYSVLLYGAVPFTVYFHDTSYGVPTTWEWDFNNDGIVDSTEQDPSWTYTSPGIYTVTLTATNSEGSGTVTKVGCIEVATWSQFQGDQQHTGYYAGDAPDEKPEVIWTSPDIDAGGYYGSGSFTIGEGKLFVLGANDTGYWINALYLDNGTVAWSKKTHQSDTWDSWATPVYHDGLVFTSGDTARHASNGTVAWPEDRTLASGINGGPLVAAGMVFQAWWQTGTGTPIAGYYAYDEKTGELLWQWTPGGDSYQSTPAYHDGKLFVSRYGGFYCLNAYTGEEIWSVKASLDPNGNQYSYCGSPTIAYGNVYVSTYNFNGDAILQCFDEDTGKLLWRKVVQRTDATPAVWDGKVYVAAGYGQVSTYCFDAYTGRQLWVVSGVGSWTLSAVVADGKVFVRGVAMDAATGEILWSVSGSSSAVIYEGRLYIMNAEPSLGEGRVICYGPASS